MNPKTSFCSIFSRSYNKVRNFSLAFACADSGLTDLRQETNILSNGWETNSTTLNDLYEKNCDTEDTWYGFIGNVGVGAIFTTFQGAGRAYLSFGNCHVSGSVKMYLNGEFFSVALPLQKKNVAFDFSVGDKLVIAEHEQSIWKLYSLSLNCN